MLSARIFHSRIHGDTVTRKEKIFGYFLGPIGVSLMGAFLTSYLNVYFTDVLGIGAIGGGLFLSALPLVSNLITALAALLMGRIVDRTVSPQGKARPWILLAAPVLVASLLLLFTVPDGSNWLRAGWILLSYLLYYAVGNVAYSTSHSLMLPLSTTDLSQRNSLSLLVNAVAMASGSLVAVIFPSLVIPRLGVDRSAWLTVVLIIAAVTLPLLLLEYYYTRERVTETQRDPGKTLLATTPMESRAYQAPSLTMKQQLRLCLRSRQWIIYVLYLLISQLFNLLANASIFYYCNWVLGTYNDGITQVLFYAIGNAPLGVGIFLCQPLCRWLGRKRAMMYGFLLAAIGCLLCLLNPTSLPLVLLGQLIKSVGLIPSTFLVTTLMADALDDVEHTTGQRCDGFSSSIFAIIGTLAGGAATAIFNFCLTHLGYLTPAAAGNVLTQNEAIRGFFSFCALGAPLISSLLLAALLKCAIRGDRRNQ